MGRALGGILAVVLLLGAGYGAGYDDYVRGMAALGQSQNDDAIVAFTAALEAGDLAPAYVPMAHKLRAFGYMAINRCKEAKADADAAMAAFGKPDVGVLMLRAATQACQHDWDAAAKDTGAAVAQHPTGALYFMYGLALWNAGKFSEAADAFAKAVAMDGDNPQKPYRLLWYAISAARAGTFDGALLDKAMPRQWLDHWPTPILKFFAGKIDEDALARYVGGHDTPSKSLTCDTDFFIGEWQLVHGDATGRAKIEEAAKICKHAEYDGAWTELHRTAPKKP